MRALLLLLLFVAPCCGERVAEWLEDDEACELCSLGASDAPRLIVKGMQGSGLGGNGMELMMGLDLAFNVGLQFGGVLYKGPPVQHGINVANTVAASLSIEDPSRLFRRDLPDSTYVLPRVFSHEELSNHLAQLESRPRWVFLNQSAFNLQKMTSARVQFSDGPHIWERLKSHALPGLTSLVHGVNTSLPQVVMHVRRGDISSTGSTSFMFLPMDYFVNIMGRVKKHLPNAQFHVFSSSEGKWGAGDFEDLTNMGAKLHLDGSVLDALAHFATSTVFVGSLSTMSEYASVLRRGCTIDSGHILMFTNWVNGGNAHKDSFDNELRECLEKS